MEHIYCRTCIRILNNYCCCYLVLQYLTFVSYTLTSPVAGGRNTEAPPIITRRGDRPRGERGEPPRLPPLPPSLLLPIPPACCRSGERRTAVAPPRGVVIRRGDRRLAVASTASRGDSAAARRGLRPPPPPVFEPRGGAATVCSQAVLMACITCRRSAGSLKAEAIRLWWPNGLGTQKQYNVTCSFSPTSGTAASASATVATRKVGFKFAPLVTINDTDPAAIAAATGQIGTGNHTVMLRVNGAAIMARGANMVPMEVLEGRYVPGQHRNIVASAAAANFNTIRVWGGGIYPLDEWLEACDDFGMLGIIDMQFSTDGIFPGAKDTPTQEAEVRHQVRRMGHHASIAVWSGCNECGSIGHLIDVVAEEDQSRAIRCVPACGLTRAHSLPCSVASSSVASSSSSVCSSTSSARRPHRAASAPV
eukprot:SAG22_NODE_1086_length_5629_cov_2.137251_5_plen_421_part_00